MTADLTKVCTDHVSGAYRRDVLALLLGAGSFTFLIGVPTRCNMFIQHSTVSTIIDCWTVSFEVS